MIIHCMMVNHFTFYKFSNYLVQFPAKNCSDKKLMLLRILLHVRI